MLPVMECIPDELLFEILMCLPAQDIYRGARLVCRKWYHIIHTHNFITTHIGKASYGLLIDDLFSGIDFISVRNGDIETYKLMNYKLRLPLCTSCNGLVLEDKRSYYCIANISTHQSIRLPPYPGFGPHWSAGMGYAAASGTYKVFAMHDRSWKKTCFMLTVGVDKSWRFISTDHLSPSAVNALLVGPMVNEGFMHWRSEGTLVTLNVETETITEASIPAVREKYRSIYCLSTGRYLSLLISSGELEWEVWEMKSETGEWRELPNICLESDKVRMEVLGFTRNGSLRPCGWVKYPEVLAFQFLRYYSGRIFLYFYNLVKREISLKMFETGCNYKVLSHKNSLVSPIGWRMLS